jgi:hypothetical protein
LKALAVGLSLIAILILELEKALLIETGRVFEAILLLRRNSRWRRLRELEKAMNRETFTLSSGTAYVSNDARFFLLVSLS